jgi:hypothetical protein
MASALSCLSVFSPNCDLEEKQGSLDRKSISVILQYKRLHLHANRDYPDESECSLVPTHTFLPH